MARPETHAIKLGRPFLSVLPPPHHCTGINESWVKTGEHKRTRAIEKVREKWGARSAAISQKAGDKYEQKRRMSHADKGGKRRKRVRWQHI